MVRYTPIQAVHSPTKKNNTFCCEILDKNAGVLSAKFSSIFKCGESLAGFAPRIDYFDGNCYIACILLHQ